MISCVFLVRVRVGGRVRVGSSTFVLLPVLKLEKQNLVSVTECFGVRMYMCVFLLLLFSFPSTRCRLGYHGI